MSERSGGGRRVPGIGCEMPTLFAGSGKAFC